MNKHRSAGYALRPAVDSTQKKVRENMNTCERWTGVLQFKKTDRIPLISGGGRQSTRAAWHTQGLPENVADYVQHAYRVAGGQLPWSPRGGGGFPVNERMIPTFEVCILEERENSRFVQNWKGNLHLRHGASLRKHGLHGRCRQARYRQGRHVDRGRNRAPAARRRGWRLHPRLRPWHAGRSAVSWSNYVR